MPFGQPAASRPRRAGLPPRRPPPYRRAPSRRGYPRSLQRPVRPWQVLATVTVGMILIAIPVALATPVGGPVRRRDPPGLRGTRMTSGTDVRGLAG